MSWTEMETPPTTSERFGNGLSKAFTSGPKIQPTAPLIAMNSTATVAAIAVT